MNILFALLIIVAILISILTIIALALWWMGVKVILLPGLGLMVSIPFILLLLLIVEVVIVLLALLVRSKLGNA